MLCCCAVTIYGLSLSLTLISLTPHTHTHTFSLLTPLSLSLTFTQAAKYIAKEAKLAAMTPAERAKAQAVEAEEELHKKQQSAHLEHLGKSAKGAAAASILKKKRRPTKRGSTTSKC